MRIVAFPILLLLLASCGSGSDNAGADDGDAVATEEVLPDNCQHSGPDRDGGDSQLLACAESLLCCARLNTLHDTLYQTDTRLDECAEQSEYKYEF